MPVVIGGGIEVGGGIGIGPGVSAPGTLILSLDAATYSGSGDWIDSVYSIPFVLNNAPTYSAVTGGGSFDFDPASAQYAVCTQDPPGTATWTVEVWHYYAGTNIGPSPCIITDAYPMSANYINYMIGSNTVGPDLQTGFYDGAWRTTPPGYQLTAGNWYQIVGTYDGTTIKLYVNNSLVTSTNYTGVALDGYLGMNLMKCWDAPDYWGGKLAIVKIYNSAISQATVTQEWNANRARFGL